MQNAYLAFPLGYRQTYRAACDKRRPAECWGFWWPSALLTVGTRNGILTSVRYLFDAFSSIVPRDAPARLQRGILLATVTFPFCDATILTRIRLGLWRCPLFGREPPPAHGSRLLPASTSNSSLPPSACPSSLPRHAMTSRHISPDNKHLPLPSATATETTHSRIACFSHLQPFAYRARYFRRGVITTSLQHG